LAFLDSLPLNFFPKGNKEGKPYNSGRELPDLVKFLNEESKTKRTVEGRLDNTAGRTDSLDALAKQFMGSADKRAELLKATETAISTLSGTDAEWAQFYVKYMKAISSKGSDFITGEKERLSKMLGGGNLAAGKLDEFVIRQNILSQF